MVSTAAADDVLQTLSLRVEGGVVFTLPEYQRDTLDYGVGMMGAARPGWRVFSPLVLQLAFESWYLPAEPSAGQQFTLGGGVRLEPQLGRLGWFFLDANAGIALTGGLQRFTFNAGIGMEFAIGRALGVGPFVRYMRTFATAQDWPSDADFIAAGVSISLRGREEDPVEGEGDRDDDGVPDSGDICPDVPKGDQPDVQRPGCPLSDQDGDGVFDRDDLCPAIPQGTTPNPERRGCPAGDTDGDGVLDHEDACPTVASGAHPDPARRGCPESDRDSDAIFDSSDQCPDQHSGPRPDPARPGCPAPDRDRDSVPDVPDACPDEPGAPTTDPRTNGCPGLVRVQDGQLRILRPVFFASNRDTILERSQPILEAVANALAASPGIRRLRIEGHTDDVAADDTNLLLSQRRANNVMARLIALGAEPGRLEAVGLGETQPLIPERSEAARAVNRRVEFHILTSDSTGAPR